MSVVLVSGAHIGLDVNPGEGWSLFKTPVGSDFSMCNIEDSSH